MNHLRSLHLVGALGTPRTELWNGREHLVVPVVALQESAIHAVNARNREFVPAVTLMASVDKWNGHPLVVDHPVRNGKQISAHDDGVLAAHGFGFIRSSAMNGKRLGMEAMIDPARLVVLKQDQLLADLRAGKSIEVSIGAFVECNDKRGTHNGRDFIGEWTSITPDHLAFLPNPKVGACSIVDGCGTGRIAERYLVTAEGFESLAALPDKSQVGGSMKVGDKVKINKPGDESYGKTGAIKSSSKGGTVHTVGDYGSFHQSELKAAGVNLNAVRRRILAIFDTPEQASSEEAAELVAYNAMRTTWDATDPQWDAVSDLIDALIADETDDPTETPEQEDAEEEVEDARLDAIRMHCLSMMAALQSISNACSSQQVEDVGPSDPRYMAALIGKTISAKNMKTVQAAHDSSHDMHTQTVALGAECNGMKVMAAKECAMCGGTGQTKTDGKQQDCAACGGTGELKTAAACRCGETTEAEMKTKVERIAALTAAGVKDITEKTSDDVLTVLEAKVENDKAHAVALKAAEAKATDAEAKLKAAEANQIPAEELTQLRSLAVEKQQQNTAAKAAIVAQLVPLKTLSKEQLEAKPLDELRTLAQFAKVQVADFSIKGVPVMRAAEDNSQYAPPNPYAAVTK